MAGALIGALRVSLSAETSAFEAGMKKSQRTAKATANSIVSDFKSAGGAMTALKAGVAGFIASLSVGTIIAAGKAALDYAGSLGEVSQQLGVTTRDLQVLRYAAGQVGVSQEQLETGLSKLTVTLGQVAAGAKAPAAALNAIGVSVDELKGKDTGEAFRIIADGLAKVTDRSQRAAIEVALFGKSGAKLDNLLSGGSAQVNALADAADRLGIVLSDEQIQRADDTADKLEALSTVLKARIAGEVADNADAILQLVDALAELIAGAGRASAAWNDFMTALTRQYSVPALFNRFAKGEVFGFNTPGQSVTVPLGKAKAAPRPRATGGSNIGQFLAGGGGGGSRRRGGGGSDDAERKRQEQLREDNQFDQEIRRAKIDVLQATRDIAADAVERYNISIQIKDAEKAAFESNLRYEVAAKERTQAQADQLQAEYDLKDQKERELLIAEENERAARDSQRLDALSLNLQEDDLRLQLQLATTAKEARAISLRLLDIARQKEQAAIDELAASRDIADQEEARRRQLALNHSYVNERQAVLNQTRGPLEDLKSRLPLDPDQLNEALENVAANGLQSLEDGLVDVLTGTKKLKEAFHQMAAQMLADLLRLAIQKYVIGSIMKLAGLGGAADGGPVPGFAYGGFVSGPGGPRADRVPAMLSNGEFVINAKSTRAFLPLLEAINNGKLSRLAMGGLAIPRASYGSRVGVSNDNAAGMPRMAFTFHNDFRGADPSSVAAIQARQDRLEAELPGRVVRTMNDARERFVWRDKR